MMYVLRTDAHGKVVEAYKLEAHKEQLIRPNEADWTKVESWATHPVQLVDLKADFTSGALLFLDQSTLVEYCRRYGRMLHVQGDNFEKGASIIVGNKDWISLKHAVAIRPKDEGPQNPSGIEGEYSSLWVPRPLFDSFGAVFTAGDDKDALWCISSRPVKRAFVYLDVSGFSKHAPGQEALIINTLVRLVNDPKFWRFQAAADALKNMEAKLCIGDGYIYVFPDALKATLFASWMAEVIQQLVARREQMGFIGLSVEFHFRMGIHYGLVYRFWDPGRNDWNYIGDGINGGNRVVGVIEKKYDDILFLSDAVVKEFVARTPHSGLYANVRNCLESRGRQEDKHGKAWRVFLLNHTKLCEPDVEKLFN